MERAFEKVIALVEARVPFVHFLAALALGSERGGHDPSLLVIFVLLEYGLGGRVRVHLLPFDDK